MLPLLLYLFMKYTFFSIFALASAAFAAPRPNIIFVLTDDLGPGDLGVLWQNGRPGTQKYQTPHIDQFAAEGRILSRHYSPAPVCAPSRASFLLGVHQGHSNVRDNQFDKELAKNHTVASVLKGAGYATANIGKWGLAGNNATHPGHPLHRGFDFFFGYLNHGDAHFHYPKEATAEGSNGRIYENFEHVTANLDKAYSTDFITARSKKWIIDHQETNPEQPFFLFLSYTAPHARLDVPTQAYPPGYGVNGGVQWTGTPGAVVNTANGTVNSWIHPDYAETTWPAYAKRHATMVRRLDDGIQDLVQTLKDLSLDENTLIVFTSDNGTHNEAGSGGSYTYNPTFFQTYGPYDGIKRDLWEGGTRVPAIVRWPAGIPAGSTSAVPSQFHDWLATFADLAGVPEPARTDGVSIVPTLTGQGTQKAGIVYSEYYFNGSTPNYADFDPSHTGVSRNQQQLIQIGDYKGVRTHVTSHEETDFRIYQVSTDVKETTNLSGQPGVPTQRDFKDLVLRNRRADSSATRPYDADLVPGIVLPGFDNGLAWEVREGAGGWVADPGDSPATATGSSSGLDLSVRTRDEDVSIRYRGYLRVPADGSYQFHLKTDTGAFVRLHSSQLLDADFGYEAGAEVGSGSILLKAGFHPITIDYRHTTSDEHALVLEWTGPGINRQEIPSSAFFVEGEPQPTAAEAIDDTVATNAGAAVSIDALSNDHDLDGVPEPLAIVSITRPAHGTAVLEGDRVIYTPRAGFHGADSLQYTITDGASQSTATIRIEVFPVSDHLWLPLDETSGEVVSDAGGRPLGSLSGYAAPGWTTGKLGGGLRFQGGSPAQKVTLSGQKGITGGDARTITFWVNVDANQAGIRSTLISWGGGNGSGAANNGRRFDINLNNSTGYRFRAEYNGGGVNFHSPTVSDPRGAGWVHVAIVVPQDGSIGSTLGYLNGQLATGTYEGGAASSTPVNTTSQFDITFGNWATDDARPFRGVLDDVRIFPRVLTAGEIAGIAAITPESAAASAWHFRNTGISNPTSENWRADVDGDGLPAALARALGGNPNIAGSTALPYFDSAAGQFIFTRPRGALASTAYVVERSPDLSEENWVGVLGGIISAADTPDHDRVTTPVPLFADSDTFIRLRVTPEAGGESFTTPPVASIRLGDTTAGQPAVKASTDSIVSIPLSRPAAFAGKVDGSTEGTLHIEGGDAWDEGKWSPLTDGPWLLSVTDGEQAGFTAIITDSLGGTVTLEPLTEGNASLIAVGSKVVIHPAWTLKSFFTPAPPAGTKVLAYSATVPGSPVSPDLQYTYTGNAWLKTTGKISPADGVVLHPGESFIVRTAAPLASLRVNGDVARYPHRSTLEKLGAKAQDIRIGGIFAEPIAIGRSQLGFTQGDRLFAYDNAASGINKSPTASLVWNGTSWIGVTGQIGVQDTTFFLRPGRGYLYQRAAAAPTGRVDWATSFTNDNP